jgi:hypothetical protein
MVRRPPNLSLQAKVLRASVPLTDARFLSDRSPPKSRTFSVHFPGRIDTSPPGIMWREIS